MFTLFAIGMLLVGALSIIANFAQPDAGTLTDDQNVDKVLTAANEGGSIVQLQSGLAGVRLGVSSGEISDIGVYKTDGSFNIQKKLTVEFLDGQWVWFDNTLKQATHQADTAADFPLGVAMKDTGAAETTVRTQLNVKPFYNVLHQANDWSEEFLVGLGVIEAQGVTTLAFDTTAEVAQAALIDDVGVPIGGNGIFEAVIRVADNGDDVALDINFGVADQSDAADADLIPESAFFHVDGNDLSVFLESDDGTTDVPAEDSGFNLVLAQYHLYQIDMRDITDVKFLIDGVRRNAGTTFVLTLAVGPMKFLAHIEKGNDNTSADVRVKGDSGIRTAKQAA